MIPFDKLFAWLFKSFNISGETLLIKRLRDEGYEKFMIIKRSWIFALFMLWIPIAILILSAISVYIAYESIAIINIQYTLIIGNILMSMILIISSVNYIRHFKSIHHEPQIASNLNALIDELSLGDKYFKSFFNLSILNQWILIGIICIELILIISYGKKIGEHFWVLTLDTIVILIEIGLLRKYRKKMMDLEMDYNIFVQGKIFFVNQSGLLSVTQTIDGDKIKTVQSIFPSKIASFFNYGTIHILTEGDTTMIGTMSMYYVTSPDKAVALIHNFIDEDSYISPQTIEHQKIQNSNIVPQEMSIKKHEQDTREKVRDVLK